MSCNIIEKSYLISLRSENHRCDINICYVLCNYCWFINMFVCPSKGMHQILNTISIFFFKYILKNVFYFYNCRKQSLGMKMYKIKSNTMQLSRCISIERSLVYDSLYTRWIQRKPRDRACIQLIKLTYLYFPCGSEVNTYMYIHYMYLQGKKITKQSYFSLMNNFTNLLFLWISVNSQPWKEECFKSF